MPSQASFSIENEKAWAAALQNAYGDLVKDGEKQISRTGQVVKSAARAKAPVLTGALRDEIDATDGRDSDGFYVDVGVGDLPDDYDVLVEYGTSDTDPQPFMRPALAEGEASFGRQ